MKQLQTFQASIVALTLLTMIVTAQNCYAQGKGKGGNKGGGSDDGGGETTLSLPPIAYEVDRVEIYGCSNHYDTSDDHVSVISFMTEYANETILTSCNKAAAIAYMDGSVEFLDNLIDPDLPYDLAAAIGINNAGQIYCVGYDGVASERRGFLLIPNPDAEADGFAYLVEPFPVPNLGEGWTYQVLFSYPNSLNEAGDVLYKILATSQDGTIRTLQSIRYSDGTIEKLPDSPNENGYTEYVTELNSARTLSVERSEFDGTTNTFSDYLLFDSGSSRLGIIRDGESFIDDLADNGFICAQFAVAAGEEKVKGKWRTIWENRAYFADPLGNEGYTTLRSGMDRRASINEQLIMGIPPIAGGGEVNTWLVYPGYDPAFLTELLLDEAELAEFDALFHWDNPAEPFSVMSTPRNSDGTVDDLGAPSLFGDLEYVTYPNGLRGHAGFYAIRPVTP
ncbi:hypothetical protein CKO51_24870 [Rhodopirellula sp. SM50]|nr:hypothetical protein [Rhodopirellula sp. SM50]PAY16777.1 hypothetical protein CKO51_24870 [Rhodopirellula sp. SM50]